MKAAGRHDAAAMAAPRHASKRRTMNFDGPVPGIPGAFIRSVDDLPAHLADGLPAGPFTHAKSGQLLLDVPQVARVLVRDGAVIEVAVDPDADPGMVTLLLNGSARGALIHQRGELPLHAATLAPAGADEGFAVCGASRAGKSTLAVELIRRGWTLVADDITRVTWDGTHAIAWPSLDRLKLWRDACEANHLDVAALQRVTREMDKYYVPMPARLEPIRLTTVIELVPDLVPELLTQKIARHDAMSMAERLSLLTRHAFRQAVIRPLGRQADFVRIAVKVASACRVIRLPAARPRPVGELADALEQL